MRILHVDTGTGWRGGQQQVLWLLEGCRELEMDQMLLAPAGSPLAGRARQSSIAVAEISKRALALGNLRTVRRLASDYDLVHAHDSHAHSLVCAAQPFQGTASPPLIVSRRVAFPVGSLGRRKYRIPALYIAVSEFVKWRLMDAGVPAEKIQVVFDGVRAPLELPSASVREEWRRRHGVDDDAFVLGTLASFAPEKMLAEELGLLQQLPASAHFWLGVPSRETDSGSAGTALLEAARRMGLEERFQLVPVGENPGAFLASLDLFLYLSKMEGLGSAILLAMVYQLPVVASNVGGIPEIVLHGQTGVLVGDEFERELPGAIQFLIGSPQTRRRLGASAREFVFARASSDKMVAQTVLLYQRLLQGSCEPRA
ncbi:MAG: glycosyltransferase family 4 protein [Acidobacteria bacterium]|nr:glycosyltransferase family 4 protein [Acidobacteriota bacterium]